MRVMIGENISNLVKFCKLVLVLSSMFHFAFNTLRAVQKDRHFAYAIFKCIFVTEDILCLDPNVPKFIPKGQSDNKSALIQVLAWCRTCSKHYLKQWWRIYASPGRNDVILRAFRYSLLWPGLFVTSQVFQCVLFDRRKLTFSRQMCDPADKHTWIGLH